MYSQKGVTLVELMIAITLSLMLMVGVVQIFLSSKTVFVTQTGISRVQETGRLAMEFLSRDIRMAGSIGCIKKEGNNIINLLPSPNNFDRRMEVGIEGYEALPAGAVLNPAPAPDTDILVVRTANTNSAVVSQESADQIFVINTGQVDGACMGGGSSLSGVCPGDFLVVSNCIRAHIFMAVDADPQAGEVLITHNVAGAWADAHTYRPGSELLTMNHIVYYIAESPVSGVRALYQNINGSPVSLELLEGVENMQLKYSRKDTKVNYEKASELDADVWSDLENPIISVRIELVVMTIDENVADEPQPYRLEGVPIPAPDDRRIRKVFINTVGVRQSLP